MFIFHSTTGAQRQVGSVGTQRLKIYIVVRIPFVEERIHGKTPNFGRVGPMAWVFAEIGLNVVGILFDVVGISLLHRDG